MNDVAVIGSKSADGRTSIQGPLDRRVATVMARARLRWELQSIARDLLGTYDPDDVPSDIGAWIEQTTESAISVVLEPSISTLIRVLESKIASAPGDVVERLDRAVVEHAIGFD